MTFFLVPERYVYVCKSQFWKVFFSAFKKSHVLFSYLSQMKVDCITVNCEPVKNVIDDLIQRLFDILLFSLRKSIQGKDGTLIVHGFQSLFMYVWQIYTGIGKFMWKTKVKMALT